MKKWKAAHKRVSLGMGSHGYANQVISPDGVVFTVNHQDVITGRVERERMPACKCCGRDSDYFRQALVDPTGNEPVPDSLCEFIVAACNAAANP